MAVTVEQLKEKLKLPIRTTFYSNFFLLRTEVVVNGQCAVTGTDEKGWLTLNSRYPQVGVTFDSLVTDVNEVLQRHGMEAVTNYWCEEMPLFELKVSSQSDLKKLIRLEERIKEELASKIAARMTAQLQSPDRSILTPSLHVLVQPRVYLLVPDYTTSTGKIIQIRKDNVTASMTLFGDSRIFDFGALFRALRTNPTMEDKGPEDLQQVMQDLCQVVGWYHLGLHLGVPDYQLQIIAQDHPRDTEMCRTKMLSYWVENTVEKKWAAVVQALVRTGSKVLACKIALKYGIPVPSVSQEKESAPESAQDDADDHDSLLQHKLRAKVNLLRQESEDKDQELAQREQTFKQVEQERVTISQGFATIRQRIENAQGKIKQLHKEKVDLEDTLELREHQLQLQQSATKEMEEQQRFVLLQEKEISGLKEKLAAVRDELEATKPQLPAMQKELQQITLELVKKSTEVHLLRESKEEMKLQLEMDRRRMDSYLMQVTAARTSDTSYRKEVEQQIHHLKKETQMKSKEMKTLQKTLKEKDEEIRKLNEHIAAQEARLKQVFQPSTLRTTDEHQLYRDIDTLNDLTDSIRRLSVVDDERHVTATQVKLLQEEANYNQKYAPVIESESSTGPFKLSLKWQRRKKRAPQKLWRGASVAHGNTIYVIGFGSQTVHSYDFDTNKWDCDEVTPCPYPRPGLIIINNLLTVVGGEKEKHLTNEVVSWKGGKWVEEFPPMHTPRAEPGLVNHGTYVVAVGGDREERGVEILDISSLVWSTVTSLPKPVQNITATLCRNDIIAMDRYGYTYTTKINSLIPATRSSGMRSKWLPLPRCPVLFIGPTLTTFHGQTLVVQYNGIYQLYEGEWVKLVDMCVPMYHCIVQVVCDQVMVVGGCDLLPGRYVSSTSTDAVRAAIAV